MTRPKSLQVHVSFELAERVRNAAERRDISVSEWIRSLLQQACDEDDLNVGLSTWLKRLNHHSVFTMVGVDALLSGHVDHDLRGRVHKAYARRCAEFGLVQTPIDGGFDEA
ncbi:ribbon-helix-helix protein, CopG family [Blastomonas sp. CCH2-E1]|jgi:LmbE family N-acetylglucosaminyl deacetylase|uniref:ribbon-helix-helix protein, CopG family n=1 Tax=Blastomonas sp. CCH2-E1 TaxID=1768740 RepID=UPI0008247806|nr:ribbon-helix-helix protein, CopG family [Blastomonas sp. CCH2-E1]